MKKIRFSHPTKTGGSSVEKAIKTKYDYIVHNHKPLCTKAQANKQGIDFSFATVRNPYDRVLDMYNYFPKLKDNYTLNQFVKKLTKGEFKKVWFLAQHYYVENNDYKVDDMLRIESFEEDWDRIIKKKLGIDMEMLHVNKTKEIKAKKLTKNQKELVYNYYKKDFELLGYEK